MSAAFRPPSPIERLPEEILLSILDYHFDIRCLPLLVATDPFSRVPQLQFQHKLQMSLCRVSKRFRESISRLLLNNGLLRVTCWVDPLLDFYYLSPTICLSERTDMFQIPCPQVTIDLAQGLPEALPVRSIISIDMLPTVLQIAQLHHTSGLTVLPQMDTSFQPRGDMTIDISCNAFVEFPFLHKAKVAVSNSLPDSYEIRETSKSIHFVITPWKQGEDIPRPSWDIAFKIGRRYSLSTDATERQLGLQVLRYLLATMLVAINPWDTDKINYADFTTDVKIMTLISAVLIDSLVVEPEMLQMFYGNTTPETIREFHREFCPCKYLPHGIQSGAKYGFSEGDEAWLFIESAIYFLHNILPCGKSQRIFRLQNFRRRSDNITLDTPGVKKRCTVYVGALERYHGGGNSYCCLLSNVLPVSYVPIDI
jgi:hypothetical protein